MAGDNENAGRRGLLVPILVAVAGMAAILAVENVPTRHGIEANLESRSATALRAAGIDGRVTFTGRDGTIYLASADDSAKALDIVKDQNGVRDAHVVVDQPVPTVTMSVTPPTTSASPSPTPTLLPSPSASPTPSATPTPTPTPSPSAQDLQRQIDAYGTVDFAGGSATLTPTDRGILDRVATLLAANPSVRLRLSGNTDSVGSAADNMALSVRRANAVRAYLVAKGVAADRLVVAAFGETRPALPNTSDANRAQNRRVDLAVIA
jgi:outer membrane protein OmpA-like peptidoglycan-associated protein